MRHLLAAALASLAPLAHAEPPAEEAVLAPVTVMGHYLNGVGQADAATQGSVTARLIANRPALRPAEVLEFVPGLIVTQHSGDGKANQYFLRGFNLDHGTDFATHVDGMPVNMVSHAHGQGYSDLNFLIPELVRRLDYRKGPYAAEDGDFSSAGSARILLADKLPRGLAQATLGPHGYRRTLLADSTGAGDGTLLGALELQGNDGPWRQPEGLRKRSGVLRYSEAGGTSRSLTLMGHDARWTATDQIPQRALDEGSLGRFDTLDPSDGGRTSRFSVSAQQREALADGAWQLSAYAIRSRLALFSNFTYALDDPEAGDQFEQSEQRRVLGGALSRRWDVAWAGRDHQLTLGTQWRQDRLSPVGLYATSARARRETVQESEVRQSQAGGYGEVSSAWTPWLRTVAGLRMDAARFDVRSSLAENSGARDARITSPKLSLILGPWRRTELFLNHGEGFHSNDARGTTARVSPSGAPAEPVPGLVGSRGSELGLRTEAVAGLQSSIALWRLDLQSELVFVGDAGDTEATRASRRTGVEWNNHWLLDEAFGKRWRGWLLDVDVAASRSRFREPAPEGMRVPGAVGRVVSAGLTWADTDSPWSGHVQLRHVGPRDLVEDGSVRSRATTLAYARAARRLSRDITLSLDVFNLFDQRANDIEYFYASRRPGEAAAVADRHVHPVEPRSARLTLSYQWR